MNPIALLAPIVLQAAAPAFSPPLDRALPYRVSELRDDATATRRFTIDRRVTFRRATDGFVAEVETLAVRGDAGASGRMFEGMARAMLGRRVVVNLDRAGKVTDVADVDAVWDAQLAAMRTTLATRDPSRAALVATLLAPLASLPRAAKVARLGEMVAPLVTTGPVQPTPERAITLPVRAQDGTRLLLAGTERIIAESDGMLRLERHASGVIAGSTTSMALRRRIDPRSGLIAESVSIDTIETAGTRQIITRSMTMTP
jgi:hypothetical protein